MSKRRGHTCHARGCDRVVMPELLMCRGHWKLVPRQLQLRVMGEYRQGQCDDKRPSREWIEAAQAAIEQVAEREGLTGSER